ncbi:hypothetical protein [Actinoplanes sp. NPDC049118]|uniref:hypothetical protein n=1 Tax=Actinoplanes sp. NPDC049118 TaxID=3155769 RepID=UPI0033FC567A
MRKLWICAGAACALALGGSSASVPPVTEISDAPSSVALGDPAALFDLDGFQGLVVSDVMVISDPDEQCTPPPPRASIPATARLGEAIAYNSLRYTISSIGVAGRDDDRVWLVVRAQVVSSGCAGSASLWDFLFTDAGGASYKPSPQGRRGEFTSYVIPAGGWATGLVFFDLPATAVPGGAVGFRESILPISLTGRTPDRPYGLWPVPASPSAARSPDTYPAN